MNGRRLCIALAGLALALPGLGLGSSAGMGGLAVTRLDSAPAGRAFQLHGRVTNSGGRVLAGPVTVRLLRAGSGWRVVGRGAVRVAPGKSARFAVPVRIPSDLGAGSYALVACAMRHGRSGPLGCATAESRVAIGGGDFVRGPKALVKAQTSFAACSSGAHSLSHFGDHVYPDTGNGGYTSLHTDVYISYDAATNMFLPGTHVVLTDQATQCLTDFSLDFERTSVDATAGPNMSVNAVEVNGQPATFAFVQPTYPGDPNGDNDPNPNAHQMSQNRTVSASNPLPPACSPTASGDGQAGQPCPANKLVITPSVPIPSGTTFTVRVDYTGRPGVHTDGDGTTEGWFRSDSQTAPMDGGFVTTEPIGTEDWMPLNNHPSAKPTYDFYDTVALGKEAIANGELVSTQNNPPDANFPGGSTTWHWHSPEPIASYLVENSMGDYDLSQRTAASGIQYYEAQGSSITVAQKTTNQGVMDQQEDITLFQSQFNGPFPFTTDGVIVGVPSASFEEEMQTKITFAGGSISLQTFNHENMHQWWGDNVAEGNYNLTFYKEGMATLGEYLYTARGAQTSAGGAGTAAGDAAFESSLISRFNTNYGNTGSYWTAAPSDPKPSSLFSSAITYQRPGTSYIALRQIMGKTNFVNAFRQIQADYGGGSITEPQLVAAFKEWMPNQSAACSSKLDQFFTQWWDTVYPTGGGANRPQITGPGLAGPGFYDGSCTVPPPWVSVAAPVDGGTYEHGSTVAASYSCDAIYPGLDPGTTLFSAASSGQTNIKVASLPPGLAVGHRIGVGSGGALDWVNVTAIGTPAVNTTLAAPAIPTATTITVTSSAGMSPGDTLTIDMAPIQETKTIQSIGTGGVITLTSALSYPHAITATVSDPGSGITFTPGLGQAHAAADPVATGCSGPVANGRSIDTSTVGSHTFTVYATDTLGNKTTKTVTYNVSGPTAVTIARFTAVRSARGVVLRWWTGTETGILGFNVYRGSKDARRRLNRAPILAGHGARGSYSFADRLAPARGRVSYWIQALAVDGGRMWFGPVRVTR